MEPFKGSFRASFKDLGFRVYGSGFGGLGIESLGYGFEVLLVLGAVDPFKDPLTEP